MKAHSLTPILIIVLWTVGTVTAARAAGSDWYDFDWKYRKLITVDHTMVDTNLSNFPVLLSVTDSDLQANANADGTDILVTESDGTTKCPREIEEYDSATGELLLWFKASSLSTNTDSEFYIYYGNVLGSETNDTATWDSYFRAVHHLQEDPTTGTGYEAFDSTSNNNDLNSSGPMAETDRVTGRIGDAWSFDGLGDAGSMANNSTLNMGTEDFTLSTWFYWTNYPSGYGHLITTHNSGGNNGPRINLYMSSGNKLRWGFYFGDYLSGASGEITGNIISLNTWYFVCVTWERGVASYVYLDGAKRLTGNSGGWLIDETLTGNQPWYIAKRGYSPYREFGGIMDEVRISKGIARNDGWVKTEYNNQFDPSGFLSLGGQELKIQGTLFIVR